MAQRRHTASRIPTAAANRSSLPPSRAFVVQIQADAEHTRSRFAGRVEHLTSGAAARFATVKELVTFIRGTIGES
jgi:hypothetical protein